MARIGPTCFSTADSDSDNAAAMPGLLLPWSYDVFAETAATEPPWYAYVLGLTGILFALSTVLVGIAGRAAGWLAAAVVVAGASFPLAFALGDTAGHVAWLVPWLVVAVALAARRGGSGERALVS